MYQCFSSFNDCSELNNVSPYIGTLTKEDGTQLTITYVRTYYKNCTQNATSGSDCTLNSYEVTYHDYSNNVYYIVTYTKDSSEGENLKQYVSSIREANTGDTTTIRTYKNCTDGTSVASCSTCTGSGCP